MATTLLREITIAEQALRRGDRKHAAHHAAAALALAPADGRAQDLVDRLLAERPTLLGRLFGAPAGEALFPDDGWVGNVAVRARAAWRRGELDEAFGTIVQVAMAQRHVSYASWIEGILDDAERAGRAIDARVLFNVYSATTPPVIGLLHLRPTERAFFAHWARVAERVVAQHARAGTASAHLYSITSAFLRRAGRFEDAVATARHAEGEAMRIQLGLSLRALGRFDEAIETFLGLLAESGESNFGLEAARACFDAGNHGRALELLVRHKGPDSADLTELEIAVEVCRAALGQPLKRSDTGPIFPDGVRRYDDIVRLNGGDGTAVVMTDASMDLLGQLCAAGRDPRTAGFKIRVDHRESPSVLLTLALATGKAIRELAYTFADAPLPDSRSPLADGGARLFNAEGETALPPPPDAVRELVAPLARLPAPAMSVLLSRAVAARADDVPPVELLAAMVHPAPPSGRFAGTEVFAWQRACALLLATQRPREPWLASRRRESLRALVLGPSDWTTAASLVALTEILLDEPEALPDVHAWLDVLHEKRPDRGHNPWEGALERMVAVVPQVRRDLARRRSGDGDADAV